MNIEKKRLDRIIQVFEKSQSSRRGKWYWNCRAGNGRILFSSETFNTKYHCKEQAVKEFDICTKAGVDCEYRELKRRRRK